MASGSRVRVRKHSSPGRWMVLSQLEKEVPLHTGERGFVWCPHSLLRGIGPHLSMDHCSLACPCGPGALRAWGPGPSLGLMVAGGRPAEVGVVDGTEVAFSQSSPSIPHSLGFCQVCTRGLSSLPREAPVELPERLPWGRGGPEPHPHSWEASRLPFRHSASRGPHPGLPHSGLRLCTQRPPWMPLHPEQIFLFFSLTLHKPVAGTQVPGQEAGDTPCQFTPSVRGPVRKSPPGTGC